MRDMYAAESLLHLAHLQAKERDTRCPLFPGGPLGCLTPPHSEDSCSCSSPQTDSSQDPFSPCPALAGPTVKKETKLEQVSFIVVVLHTPGLPWLIA